LGAVWRPVGEDARILVVGDDFHQGRIEDDPVVPLLHGLRAYQAIIAKTIVESFPPTVAGVGSVEAAV